MEGIEVHTEIKYNVHHQFKKDFFETTKAINQY